MHVAVYLQGNVKVSKYLEENALGRTYRYVIISMVHLYFMLELLWNQLIILDHQLVNF